MASRLTSIAVVGLAIMLVASGCSSESRPTVEEWQPQWESVLEAMPTQEELGDPPDPAICNETLVMLRRTGPSLRPTPDPTIDDVVRDWVHTAETIVFDCPPQSQALPNLTVAYGVLERLEAEVAVVLELDTDAG